MSVSMNPSLSQNPLSNSEFEMEKLISNKEDEIKKIFYAKIKSLNETLTEKNVLILSLEEKLEKLKSDFDYNYGLIEERDNDLKIYEEKIESFEHLLRTKDEEAKELKRLIDEINLKLHNEKNKRENNEELLRFNISKLNNNHKEEIKNLNFTIDELRKEISNIIDQEKNKIQELKYSFESEKRKLQEENEYLNLQLKRMKETSDREDKLKIHLEEMQNNLSKMTNENLSLIKEKIHIENKLKIYENNENETRTNNFVICEKNKYLTKEIEDLKLEISSKSHKIDSLNKLLEESSSEVNSLKQKIQIKDFDMERKSLSEKLLNEKLRECNYQIEKLIEEKRTIVRDTEEDKLKLQGLESKIRNQTEEIFNFKFTLEKCQEENKKLKEEIENLNKRIRELLTINSNNCVNDQLITKDLIKDKKEETSEMLDFFSNKNNLMVNKSLINNNQKSQNFENLLKEKEAEIERLNKELEGAKMILLKVESEMSQTYNLFKQNENNYIEKINRLELEIIRKDIEVKNSINLSISRDKENSNNLNNLNDLNEIVQNYKTEVKLKNEIISKLKESLEAKVKELQRMKKEREKMASLCVNLRAQVNRFENQNIFPKNRDENDNFSPIRGNINESAVYHHKNDISILSSKSVLNLSEYEEYKKKKDLILGNSREDEKIRQEAKRHIENAMSKNYSNFKEREGSVKSNGFNKINILKNENSNNTENRESYNLRKIQVGRNSSISRSPSNKKSRPMSNNRSISRSQSRSKSRSKSPFYKQENLLDAIKISKVDPANMEQVKINNPYNNSTVNNLGLKLLKRERNKSETKY
jgi:chromosome segregation ATPase